MLVGLAQGWGPAFAKAVYRAEFVHDEPIADAATLMPLIERSGGDPQPVLTAAAADATKSMLRTLTEEAKALGIFGAPTFVCRGELFWGDDRLEEALAWCRGAHPAQVQPDR